MQYICNNISLSTAKLQCTNANSQIIWSESLQKGNKYIYQFYIYENSSRNKIFFSLRHNVINFVSLISIDGTCFSDGLLKKKIFPALQDKVN